MEKGRYYFSGELEVVGSMTPSGMDVTYLKVRPSEDEEWLFLPETWLDAEKVVEEPGDGGVVLDVDGDAWQASFNGWNMAGANDDEYRNVSWDMLVQNYGPVTVIHDPED
jgi:hypothetical protein